MEILAVGLGGFLGSMARYGISSAVSSRMGGKSPSGTLAVNLSGALLLGMVMGYAPSPTWWLFLGEGFLGAFTTFSTWMREGMDYLKEGRSLKAWLYMGGSTLLGVLALLLGRVITTR